MVKIWIILFVLLTAFAPVAEAACCGPCPEVEARAVRHDDSTTVSPDQRFVVLDGGCREVGASSLAGLSGRGANAGLFDAAATTVPLPQAMASPRSQYLAQRSQVQRGVRLRVALALRT